MAVVWSPGLGWAHTKFRFPVRKKVSAMSLELHLTYILILIVANFAENSNHQDRFKIYAHVLYSPYYESVNLRFIPNVLNYDVCALDRKGLGGGSVVRFHRCPATVISLAVSQDARSEHANHSLRGKSMNVYRSILSFVIHKNGIVSESDIDQRLAVLLDKKGVIVDRQIFKDHVAKSLDFYYKHHTTVLVCTDGPCLKNIAICPSESEFKRLSDIFGCPVQSTGCHWHCANGPAITLKHGAETETFEGCNSSEHWDTVKEKVQTLLSASS